jgi:hypothetical protein
VERLNPFIASTMIVMTNAPAMSRIALMACTQVVPFMPPRSTYMIMRAPTTVMTTACPPQSEMPRSRATRKPME